MIAISSFLTCSFRVHQSCFRPHPLAGLRRTLLLKGRGGEGRGVEGTGNGPANANSSRDVVQCAKMCAKFLFTFMN